MVLEPGAWPGVVPQPAEAVEPAPATLVDGAGITDEAVALGAAPRSAAPAATAAATTVCIGGVIVDDLSRAWRDRPVAVPARVWGRWSRVGPGEGGARSPTSG
ncbi:hypothetical protein GCM10025883_33540 [Mobilicoccus caccae]|uniref:Uncharacterized protein n=1 Tax=Mobilicoccus caccae TaxID=1859295 RepID=A0ABQ6IX88_9MICO|nr:hypothetical protein GCM10025883_33540 [Mobilicoccus caccae]